MGLVAEYCLLSALHAGMEKRANAPWYKALYDQFQGWHPSVQGAVLAGVPMAVSGLFTDTPLQSFLTRGLIGAGVGAAGGPLLNWAGQSGAFNFSPYTRLPAVQPAQAPLAPIVSGQMKADQANLMRDISGIPAPKPFTGQPGSSHYFQQPNPQIYA